MLQIFKQWIVKSITIIMVASLLSACAYNPEASKDKVTQAYQQGNYTKVVSLLYEKAKYGDKEAQYGLGYMYFYGQGVAEDKDKGLYWITKSARAGYPPAVTAFNTIMGNAGALPTTSTQYDIAAQ